MVWSGLVWDLRGTCGGPAGDLRGTFMISAVLLLALRTDTDSDALPGELHYISSSNISEVHRPPSGPLKFLEGTEPILRWLKSRGVFPALTPSPPLPSPIFIPSPPPSTPQLSSTRFWFLPGSIRFYPVLSMQGTAWHRTPQHQQQQPSGRAGVRSKKRARPRPRARRAPVGVEPAARGPHL